MKDATKRAVILATLGAVAACGGVASSASPEDRAAARGEADLSARIPPRPRPIITSSGEHTCALRAGKVYCWGHNSFGELGNGTTTSSPTPVAASLPAAATDLSAGDFSTCAVDVAGIVWCWGTNASGELGTGTFAASTVPVRAVGLPPIARVWADTDTTCAVARDGTVWCWGDGSVGSLGNGSSGLDQPTPVQVTGITNAVAVSGHGIPSHMCALLGDGSVWCWGENLNGELGDGTHTNQSVPVQAEGVSGAVGIAAGTAHTCVLLSNGGVSCWGSNFEGECGIGSSGANVSAPTAVVGLPFAVQISAGDRHTCARVLDGTMRCWGRADQGQLGDGTEGAGALSDVPVVPGFLIHIGRFTFELPLEETTWVSAGDSVSCASTVTGAYCWGNDTEGQLGDGTASSTFVTRPARVVGLP